MYLRSMPKKEEAREVDDRDEGEVELPRPINLGDTLTIKRLLDEATAATVENCNYPPDNTLSNIQLFWGVNAVLIAPLAHFYPLPFPESRTILFICCVCYFFCYGVLQVRRVPIAECVEEGDDCRHRNQTPGPAEGVCVPFLCRQSQLLWKRTTFCSPRRKKGTPRIPMA